MDKKRWVVIDKVAGDLQAEILRGLLEAQGIQVLLSQEGAGRALGLSVGPLGEVEILVPEEQRQEASQVLTDYQAGFYETEENLDEGEENQSD